MNNPKQSQIHSIHISSIFIQSFLCPIYYHHHLQLLNNYYSHKYRYNLAFSYISIPYLISAPTILCSLIKEDTMISSNILYKYQPKTLTFIHQILPKLLHSLISLRPSIYFPFINPISFLPIKYPSLLLSHKIRLS